MSDKAQFIIVATFIEGTHMPDVLQVVDKEKAKVKELQDAGRMGSIRLAVPQGKVFLDVFGADEADALRTVTELPMSRWWELEAYTLSGTA